jgi:PKD repeat protein
MKKGILLLVLAIFTMYSQIHASTVSLQAAQTIAANFYKVTVPGAANASIAPSLAYTQTEMDGSVDFYAFNVAPLTGFVVVSAENNATPILAYSAESNFPAAIPATIGLHAWARSAGSRIHYITTNNIQADTRIQALWSAYAQGTNPNSARATTVGPLLTITWNQEPYYNSLCPPAAQPSTSATKSVTGCVATAMAQIMRYWNYPAQGTGGTISYSDEQSGGYTDNYGTLSTNLNRPLIWSAMTQANITSNTSAVDSLMYELGVSVHMDYDPAGSGAFVLQSEVGAGQPCAQYSYLNYFHYNTNTMQGIQLSAYTDANWVATMENEINAGRVVQYEGDDPTEGGHTWVMDGYETSATASGGALLHMNWGWGGADDGWFDVTNLSTPGFNPVDNDAALIGIEPIAAFSLVLTPSNPSVCPGSAGTTLSASGPAATTYVWSPATGLSCTTCASPVANPAITTLYTVRAYNGSDSVISSVAVAVSGAVTAAFSFNPAVSCSLPENVTFSNSSTNATSYVWDFGDGTATSTAAAPQHAYTANGNYTASLYATNACGVDSLIKTQAVAITNGPPVANSASICNGQTATLTAVGADLTWYSDPNGYNAMVSGNTFTTPALTGSATYYVQSAITPNVATVGPANDAIGTNSEFTATSPLRGMIFNCTMAQTLNSVVVYAVGAGPRLFVIEDSATGTIIDSMTVALTNGQQTVQLGFTIPAQNSMVLGILGTTNMTRNSSGAVFPYVSSDGTVTITNNNAAAAGRWYYCYDWQLQQNSCSSALVPVTVYVLSSGGGAFTATGTGTPVVNFAPTDLSATTYSWSFGDGATSADMSPIHTYATGGSYTVTLVVSNGTCSDTITQLVDTKILAGINELSVFSAMSVYPNPARDMVTLSINSAKQMNGCAVTLNNVLGQSAYNNNIDLTSGTNKLDINVSGLAAGIYFITIQNGKDEVTAKFVKSDN